MARPIPAATVAALTAAAPLVVAICQGATLVWRDTARLYEPTRALVVAELSHGKLPLWNPYEAFGHPLFAQLLHAVLHPISLALAFAWPGAGTNVTITCYVAFAAAGAALLASELGVSPAGQILAGVGFALSGYVLGMSSVILYLGAASVAPWAILGVARAPRGLLAVASGSLGVAAIHFSGEPQWAIVAIIIGLALCAAIHGARGVVLGLAAVLVGTALAAVQLVPAAMYFFDADRFHGLNELDRALFPLSPWRLIEFFAPGLFGRPSEFSPVFAWLGGATAQGLTYQFVPSIFIGGPLLFLSALALRSESATRRTRRSATTLAVACGVLLWVALGRTLGATQALSPVPVWGSFRYPEKLVGPLTLCLTLLAGMGLDRLRKHPRRWWPALLFVVALATAAMAVVLWTLTRRPSFAAADGGVTAACQQLATGLAHGAVSLSIFAALLFLVIRGRLTTGGFGAAVAVLVFLESIAAAPYALHFGRPGVIDRAPLRAIASPDRVVRIATPLENESYQIRGGRGPDDIDLLLGVKSRCGVPLFSVPSSIDQVETYSGFPSRRYTRLKGRLERAGGAYWNVLRRLGLTHVVAKVPTSEGEARAMQLAIKHGMMVSYDEEWLFSVWEVPHRGWASFAPRIRSLDGEEAELEVLVSGASVGDETVAMEHAGPQPESTGRVLGATRTAQALRIEAESPANAILVINDAYAPGWQATIDGSPVPIWRADYLMRAVPWPEGRHILEMHYVAPGLAAGKVLSGVAAAMLAIAGFLGLARGQAGQGCFRKKKL